MYYNWLFQQFLTFLTYLLHQWTFETTMRVVRDSTLLIWPCGKRRGHISEVTWSQARLELRRVTASSAHIVLVYNQPPLGTNSASCPLRNGKWVLAKEQWQPLGGKATVGLASHTLWYIHLRA